MGEVGEKGPVRDQKEEREEDKGYNSILFLKCIKINKIFYFKKVPPGGQEPETR